MENFIKNLSKYSNEDELFEDLSKFISVDNYHEPNFSRRIYRSNYENIKNKINSL